MKSYTLTKAEIQIMNILWEKTDGACVRDIIAQYAKPKPAYTTIATFMKILLNKKFVAYRKETGVNNNMKVYQKIIQKYTISSVVAKLSKVSYTLYFLG